MRSLKSRGIVALVAVVALLGSVGLQQPVQAQEAEALSWSDEFSLEGFDDQVSATLADGDGNLYVGGEFTTHNGTPVNYMAMWNGTSWSGLGAGLNGPVWSMALDASGNLVVGGYFSQAGDVEAHAIAVWDGQTWTSLPGLVGNESAVGAIVVDPAGGLVVAEAIDAYDRPYRGFFATKILVSRWDGASWVAMGTARSTGQTNTRPSLAFDDAGVLISAAGASINAWVDGSWIGVGVGQPQFGLAVLSIHSASDGALLVTSIGGAIYRWGSEAWSDFYTPEADGFAAVGVFTGPADSLVAVGRTPGNGGGATQIVQWDGATWVPLAEVADGDLVGLANYGSGLVGFGTFREAGPNGSAFLATWSGTEWSSLGATQGGLGLNGEVHDMVADGHGNTYVAGDFTKAGTVSVASIAKWDGTNWTALGAGINGTVDALAIDSQGDLIVGGFFTQAGGVEAANIARWDGSEWSSIGTGLLQPEFLSSTHNVLAIVAGDSGTLFAGGVFEQTGDGREVNHIARWNGEQWQALDTGLDRPVRALALGPDGTLVAAGSFLNGAARWNGQSWSSLGSRFSIYEEITDVAIQSDGTIYASGYFAESNGVARWDGGEWVRLGPPVEEVSPLSGFELPWAVNDIEDVYEMEIDSSGGILIGGRFRAAGGKTVNHLARWNGESWNGFGPGTDGAVTALEFGPDNELLVGGRFVNAGGVPASRFTVATGWLSAVIGSVSEATTVDDIVHATDYDAEHHGDVLRLYQAFFHRDPDVDGAKYWIGLNSDGYGIDAISKFFAATDEFNNNYEGTSNELFVGAIYLNVLGRSHDSTGFDYWLDLLDTGQLSRGDLVRWIAANDEFIANYPYQPLVTLKS